MKPLQVIQAPALLIKLFQTKGIRHLLSKQSTDSVAQLRRPVLFDTEYCKILPCLPNDKAIPAMRVLSYFEKVRPCQPSQTTFGTSPEPNPPIILMLQGRGMHSVFSFFLKKKIEFLWPQDVAATDSFMITFYFHCSNLLLHSV